MQHALRRTAVIVASSAVVLSGVPLLNSAFADTPLTQSSVTPTNAQTVKNSHPAISATYTDNSVAANLDPSSTIAVSKGGTASIGCTGVVSGNTITCNYSGLLTAGSYSIVIHAVEAANTAKTADNTTTFTVNVPTRSATNTTPGENSRVQSFSSVTVNFDQAIDDQHSTISVQQIADKQPDGSYAPASHTPLTNGPDSPSFPNDGQTVTMQPNNTATEIRFTPSSAPVNKGIYRVTVDVFGTNGTSQPQTTPATENANAETQDSYTFTMDDPLPPPPPPPGATNLAVSPTPVTKASQTAVTFSGNAVPGNTITVDATDGTAHVNNAGSTNGGPVSVTSASCSTSTSCAWSKTFDLTSLSDGTITWTATETAPLNSTTYSGSTPESGPSFTKDTTPPASPSVTGSFSPSNSTTLHVTGGSDSTVDHYTLDIHDAASPNHTIPTITLDKSADGGVAGNGTFTKDVDVSSLDDGTITMSLIAFDQYGNHTATAVTNTATKAVGLLLDFDASTFRLANTDTPSFPDVLARPNHTVQKPSQIAIKFSNPIELTLTDNGHVDPQNTTANDPLFVEVLQSGDGNSYAGTQTVDPNDSRQLLVTPPNGLADGTYKLKVQAFQKGKCTPYNSDPMPVGTGSVPTCPSQWNYNDYVKVPDTATPFTFTVDTQPPAAPTVETIPSGSIDGSNVGDVIIKGTGEAGATITLTAKSNGGGSVLALNQGQPVTVGNDGKWSDEEDNAALAVLPDGTLTISATPTDTAGNTGTIGTGMVTLAARPSIPRSLSVSQTDSSFTLHWAAPSYDGFPALPSGDPDSHLTGYRYTYQDTTNGALDTDVHSVSVDNPGATSATQGNLLAGHSYAVTLCALNNVSGPCNTVSTTAMPAYFTAITAKVSKALVVYGTPITLSGRLTRTDIGAGIANEPVKVTPRFDNGTTGTVIHLTTNSLGNWSVTIAKPSKNALYLVSFNDNHADPTYQASGSSVRSLVAVSLRIDKVTSTSTSHTLPITISGHITPNQSGRSVAIYARSASATHYQRIGYAKISSKSTWAFTRTFGKGKFYLYASFANQNGNVGGHSQTVTFTRS